jgi:hypothetical protein
MPASSQATFLQCVHAPLLRIAVIAAIDLNTQTRPEEENIQKPPAPNASLTREGVAKLAAFDRVENPRKLAFCGSGVPFLLLGEFLNAAARSMHSRRRCRPVAGNRAWKPGAAGLPS